MNWKNWGIRLKITVTIGAVLLLLLVMGILAYIRIDGIVEDGVEVLTGNQLRSEFLENQVGQFVWALELNEFLERGTELTIELDHRQCKFGRWYYGEERRVTEKKVPALREYLGQIEEPHRKLHQSAAKIKNTYRQADIHLPGQLSKREAEHLDWANVLQNGIISKQVPEIELDHTRCNLGRFIYGAESQAISHADPEQAELLVRLEPEHQRLHAAGKAVSQALAKAQAEDAQAQEIYRLQVSPALQGVRSILAEMRERAESNIQGKLHALEILHEETQPLLEQVQNLLGKIAATIKEHLLSEQGMIDNARQTQWIILFANALGFLLAAFAVYYIVRDLLRQVGGEPIAIAAITERVASGDLDVDLGDENENAGGIYGAVRKMVHSLRSINREREAQNWLKTGQAQLNERLRGEQDIHMLAKNSIDFLVTYLDVQVGLFYVVEEDEDDQGKKYLRVEADYGCLHENGGTSHKFYLDDGLVGQVVLERRPILRHHTQAESAKVSQSGLARAVLSDVLLLPFLYEDTVKGIVELGSHQAFTDLQRNFLEQAMPSIGIAVNAAESRKRTQLLLEQSEAQAEELLAQQAEMEKQQAELQENNEKLITQTEELRAQSEEMQAQAEQLQVQQEELRQTNEQLEYQQKSVEQKNSDLEKAKSAIQAKAEELELTSKYKSEFLANMSHELRTPLNSLLILAQMLAENKTGNLTEKQIEQAQTIHSAGADLLTLINDILDLSKVEAGKLQLHVERFPLKKLIDNSRQRFQPLAERKGLTFGISVAEGLPEHITSDVQRLQQVLTNLFSNAFKFTAQGAVELHVYRPGADEMEGLQLDAAHSIAFSVADTGIGIPAGKLQVIFEAFQQADGTTSRRYGGTGLGLSISRQLARLLGGDIRLHSEENHGSTFTLYVPEKLAAPQADGHAVENKTTTHAARVIPATSPAPPAAPPTGVADSTPSVADDRGALQPGDKSILIVDDDPKFSAILIEAGREQGYKCLLAENGRDALTMAEQYKPDAVILDIGLPLVDGLTVMDKLKGNLSTRHIPIHVISAGEHGRAVKQMGALGYSMKPVDMGKLHEAFIKLRHIVDQEMRRLLIISDSGEHRDKITNLLAADDVDIEIADTAAKAVIALQTRSFDCVVLDMDAGEALSFLERLRDTQEGPQAPFIFYAERELTGAEEQYMHAWQPEAPLKAVYSPERLVDEVTLFLHQVEAELPEEKRTMLRTVHDKEAVLKGRKVLLVDDDMRNVYALSTVLENKGMQVLAAEDGKQALAMLEQQADVDVVLMDIMMPEMDGYETMRRIRAQPRFRKLPILALTAKAMKEDRSKCLEAGANDYLSKPINSDQLLSLLRVWLYR